MHESNSSCSIHGLTNPSCKNPPWNDHISKLADFATMTHYTSIAITSGLAHAFATLQCFTQNPEDFNKKSFIQVITDACKIGDQFLPNTLEDRMQDRFELLNKEFTPAGIIEKDVLVVDHVMFTTAFLLLMLGF